MRSTSVALTIFAGFTISTAAFQLHLPFFSQGSLPVVPHDDTPDIMPDGPLLADLLPTTRQTSIFASLTRSVDSVDEALSKAPSKGNYTVLSPSNSALNSLPRKPWEDAQDYQTLGANAYEGDDGEQRAQRNLRRFVEAHVVVMHEGESSWGEGKDNRRKTVLGEEVWWETREGHKVVQPGEVKVQSVVERVANGELWVLDGVVNYKSSSS